jgi:RecA-family ATPase
MPKLHPLSSLTDDDLAEVAAKAAAEKDKKAGRKPQAIDEAPAIVQLPVVSASFFADQSVPERRWIVPDMIPDRTVTIASGDGAVGKSTLMLQLAVAIVGGAPWIGKNPDPGPVVVVSAEDDIEELHRRLDAIARGLAVSLADLVDLHLIPLAGKDAVLAAPEGKTSIIRETPVWRGLVAIVERAKPRLLILDTRADVFAGHENDRSQARQFVGLLRGLAIAHNLAVVLIEHPSLVGLSSGTGTSGSTGWNNAVRSRLYLETIKDDAGEEIDAGLRVLRVMKANYGPAGQELRLHWRNGLFVLDGAGGGFDKLIADAKAERVFLDLLGKYAAQGRDVSDSPGSNYAPAEFAGQGPQPATKDAMKAAMRRLILAGRIRVETFGPPSRQRKRLVIEPAKEGE